VFRVRFGHLTELIPALRFRVLPPRRVPPDRQALHGDDEGADDPEDRTDSVHREDRRHLKGRRRTATARPGPSCPAKAQRLADQRDKRFGKLSQENIAQAGGAIWMLGAGVTAAGKVLDDLDKCLRPPA